jgi:hypothetical protein
MGAMGKLEAENILPKGQRPLEVRDRYAGVIGGDDAKWHISENVQRATLNVQRRIQRSGQDQPDFYETLMQVRLGQNPVNPVCPNP